MTVVKRRGIDIAAVVALALAFVFAMTVEPDVTQGDVQRIMYVHVPSAWLAFLAFGVTLVGSIAWLRTRRMRWDRLAYASAHIGVFFTGLAIVLGSIWAKPVWGTWWQWEPRLVTTALLFFIYLGYLALRRAVLDPGARARRAAVFGIVAFLQVPLVYFSVDLWRGIHQTSSRGQLDGPIWGALWFSVAAFTLVYVALMRHRLELAKLEEELEARQQESAELAGDAVTAPVLEGIGDAV